MGIEICNFFFFAIVTLADLDSAMYTHDSKIEWKRRLFAELCYNYLYLCFKNLCFVLNEKE